MSSVTRFDIRDWEARTRGIPTTQRGAPWRRTGKLLESGVETAACDVMGRRLRRPATICDRYYKLRRWAARILDMHIDVMEAIAMIMALQEDRERLDAAFSSYSLGGPRAFLTIARRASLDALRKST